MKKQADWDNAAWLDDVENWIDGVLKTEGLETSGSIEIIHSRLWSCVLRIPTNSQTLYFKATADFASHEIGLSSFLSKLAPELCPKLIATDVERGWMIMRDGGQRLRESLIAKPEWEHWERLLPEYASLQQEAAKSRDEILALGVRNLGLAELARLYQEWLAVDWFQIDSSEGISTSDYQRLQDLAPLVKEKAEALASYRIPESLHHGDLHDANIFHDGSKYSFFDWGDSSFSHPFFSLRTAFVSVENRFGLDEGSPELIRLRNPYLAAWREYETEAHLLEAFGLAEELWVIPTAQNWAQVILASSPETRQDYAHIMPSLAKELLGLIKA
jgi:hypothetical protein